MFVQSNLQFEITRHEKMQSSLPKPNLGCLVFNFIHDNQECEYKYTKQIKEICSNSDIFPHIFIFERNRAHCVN